MAMPGVRLEAVFELPERTLVMAATPSVTETALSVGSRIGRYFSLTSLLPTLLLVLWVYLLVKSGAWSGEPVVPQALKAFGSWSLVDVAWAIVATFIVASFTHSLQFPMTQLLEGYWPSTGLAGRLQFARVMRYRRQLYRLDVRLGGHEGALSRESRVILDRLRRTDPELFNDLCELSDAERVQVLLDMRPGDSLMRHILGKQDVQRRMDRFPAEPNRLLPTRLGNVLRRYEDRAGAQYGLSAISVMPHLLLIAPQNRVDYVNDMRQSMDTSIRLCAISLTATVVSVPFLATDGWWLLLALVPYALAYLAYRGSVAAAVHYGIALCTIIDLDRFQLYESLRLPIPHSLAAERRLNEKLQKLLDVDTDIKLRYQPKPTGAVPES